MKANEINTPGYYWYFDEQWWIVKIVEEIDLNGNKIFRAYNMPTEADTLTDYEGYFNGPLQSP